MTISVNEANMKDHFGKTDEPISFDGNASVDWLHTTIAKKELNTSSREYQREKVASVRWKQNIMRTVLVDVHARIPQIHIRVNNLSSFEVIDGQQRATALSGYLNGEFPLPDGMLTSDKINVSGMYADELRKSVPKVYEQIKAYRVAVVWYENLDDDQVSKLFVEVLNNVNSMKPQEIRNAIRGHLSSYIRDRVRSRDNVHPLFTRKISPNGKKEKIELPYIPKLKLNGRMEADEWFTQLIYLNEKGAEHGIKGQGALTRWIREVQLPDGDAGNRSKFSKIHNRCEELLTFAFKVISSVDDDNRNRMAPMTAMTLVLYGRYLEKEKSYRVSDPKKFAEAYFDVIDCWSDTKDKLYANHTTADGGHLPPMNQLFGGKNDNAFKTIFWILNKELADRGDDEFGIILLDHREKFTETDKLAKWKEQGGKCYYTGQQLKEDELVGDHNIPHSWGVKRGGVTEYHNLVITNAANNQRKLNMSGDQYIEYLKENPA